MNRKLGKFAAIDALYLVVAALIVCCTHTPQQVPKMSDSARQYYTELFGVDFDGTEDTLLLAELQTWLDTPYSKGSVKKGVGTDCSGFVQNVYRKIYGINLARTAKEMSKQIIVEHRRELKCGNLVFFRDWIGNIAHVGIYLGQGKFIHAATGNNVGICINDLNSKHYLKRYWAGGYVKAENK